MILRLSNFRFSQGERMRQLVCNMATNNAGHYYLMCFPLFSIPLALIFFKIIFIIITFQVLNYFSTSRTSNIAWLYFIFSLQMISLYPKCFSTVWSRGGDRPAVSTPCTGELVSRVGATLESFFLLVLPLWLELY